MDYTVRVLKRASTDVLGILQWLYDRSPQGAARWYQAFTETCKSLERTPDAYGLAIESEHVGLEIRQRLFKTRGGRPYRMLYIIVGREVRILHVRGPGQQPITSKDITN